MEMTEVKDRDDRRDKWRWGGGSGSDGKDERRWRGREREGGEGGKEKSPERSKEPTGARSMDL